MYQFNVTTFDKYSLRKLSHSEFMNEFGQYIHSGLELYEHITDFVIVIDNVKYLIRRVDV